MSRLAALAAAAALAALPIAATGCGADDADPAAIAQAAEATQKQGGVHMTMTGDVETQGQTIPLNMEADADLQNLRMRATMEMQGQIPRIEQVMIGTVMYMKMEGMQEAFGAEWVKFDLARVGEEMGIDFEQLLQMGSTSPAQQLDYLRAMADLEEVGTEEIDGVETTHYKGEVDMRKYPDLVPPERRAKARQTVDKLIEISGQAKTPTEVWIGEDKLIRRQRTETTIKKPNEMRMKMEINYSDFGKRVDIEAPEGAKDITELAAQGAGSASG